MQSAISPKEISLKSGNLGTLNWTRESESEKDRQRKSARRRTRWRRALHPTFSEELTSSRPGLCRCSPCVCRPHPKQVNSSKSPTGSLKTKDASSCNHQPCTWNRICHCNLLLCHAQLTEKKNTAKPGNLHHSFSFKILPSTSRAACRAE